MFTPDFDSDPPAPRPILHSKPNWIGILADALSGLAGNGPIYAPIAERRREEQSAFERGEEQYRRHRADQQSDWQRDRQYEQDHPTPRAPYRWESNDGSLMEVGPDGMVRSVYKDPTPKMNFIPDGMGGGTWAAMPVQTPQSPADLKPVGKLTPMGGPMPRASGGFPR